MQMPPLKVFIIYAHEDRAYKEDLLKSLKLLRKQGLVEAWHDRDLLAGDDWEKVILAHLQSAHLILPIISTDFFNSDFIEKVEIIEAFQRYEKGEAHILPIIARPCRWIDDPHISKLQALPEDGRPIARWESRDDAFESVYDGIKAKINQIHNGWRAAAQAEMLREEDVAAYAAAHTRADLEAYLKTHTLHAEAAHQRIAAFQKAKKQKAAQYLPEMILITGGTFQMGDTFDEGQEREKPVHSVTLSDFYLGQYAVTFEEYDRFCAETKHEKPSDEGWGRAQRPVINVSWEDAQAYCQWLSQKTGKNFRLPTEAEWEYAAREGGKKVRFGNGKDLAYPAEINFDASEKCKRPYSMVGEYRQKTIAVGSLHCPNALGLHDMSGNVWEWCADWFGTYPTAAQTNPVGPADGSYRVLRGGSWNYDPQLARVADRSNNGPTNRLSYLGFRLARTL